MNRTLALLAIVGLLATACRLPANTTIDLSPLFVEIDQFPEGWSDPYGISVASQGPLGSAKYQFRMNINYQAPNNGAYQDVRLFRNPSEASEEFSRQTQLLFREEFKTWHPTTEIDFHSAIAEQYRLECAKDGVDMLCTWVAQYSMLVVSFSARVGSTLTYAEFSTLLQSIDLRFESYLSATGQ